ncbi:MAG: exodeoxyribonuclease VII large subunit, partial [Clostridia bacterium]|nr:exodeoxyribonuclease VII large subunit [Clostridia bacterium]
MISERRENALTVGELNRYVKMLMDNDALLSAVSVQGEISNLKYHSSGHLYFTLKDGEAEISAVMFRSAAVNLKFMAKDGMQVVAFGRVSVYEKGGKCQLYVSAMLDNGIGALQLEYERLKKQLEGEGLF